MEEKEEVFLKSNWEVLKEKVINDDKDGVSEWLRKFKKYSHTFSKDYLEMDSNEIIAEWEEANKEANKEALEKFAAQSERYLVSAEELKRAIFGEWKGV